jgi:hypothetical protein
MDEVPSEATATEVELPILTKCGGPSPLDGSVDATGSLPPQASAKEAPQSLFCGSSSPLIKIVTIDELHNKYTADTPPAPANGLRRHGSKCRSIVKAPMAYNEYGELVEESTLRRHPTTDELNVTQLLRVIKKGAHHAVSTPPN